MDTGTVTVDLHGKNTYQAKVAIDALLRRAVPTVFASSTAATAEQPCGTSSVPHTAATPRSSGSFPPLTVALRSWYCGNMFE